MVTARKAVKAKINCEDVDEMCYMFHRLSRISDSTKNLDLWNAIDKLPDYSYYDLMEDALREIGIVVDDKYICDKCGAQTKFSDAKAFYKGVTKYDAYQMERRRLHERRCRDCFDDGGEIAKKREQYDRMQKIMEAKECELPTTKSNRCGSK